MEQFENKISLSKKPPHAWLSFPAFLRYLVHVYSSTDPKIHEYFTNRHWYPMHKICRPCLIDFEYFSKIESIGLDGPFVLGKLTEKLPKGKSVGDFPKLNGSKKSQSKTPKTASLDILNKLKNAYEDIDSELLEKIYEIYKWDFEMFGYDRI